MIAAVFGDFEEKRRDGLHVGTRDLARVADKPIHERFSFLLVHFQSRGADPGAFGKGVGDRPTKVGGWGHVLGDKGSGYDIGLSALQAVILEFDRSQRWPARGWAASSGAAGRRERR